MHAFAGNLRWQSCVDFCIAGSVRLHVGLALVFLLLDWFIDWEQATNKHSAERRVPFIIVLL